MLVAKGILTNGLGGGPDAMILGKFTLAILSTTIEIVPLPRGGGAVGPSPIRYHLRDDDDDIIIKQDKYLIIIRTKMRNKETRKEFTVGERRKNFLISVINLINSTRDRINLTVTNVKARAFEFAVKIKNLIRK